MAPLKPAGFFSAFISFLFPKEVSAHVRTEALSNGQIQLTPVFTIDGQEVPPEQISRDRNQNVLGYNVVLDGQALSVHEQTQGKVTRLTKKKAAEFLAHLGRSRVPVRSRDGKIEPRIETVKPDVSLELRPDDSLQVQSDLCTAKGVVLDKPSSLEQLKEDDGWYVVGEDLLRVETSNTSLDQVLIADGGNGVLSGEEVPRFLKLLEQQSGHVGAVEKNAELDGLSVYSDNAENLARVDGDAESISISTSLRFPGRDGRQYEQSPDVITELERQGGGFQRVPDGWVEVSPEAIRRHREACGELQNQIGKLDNIQGADIPETLAALQEAARRNGAWSSPWSVYFSQAVKNAHRVVETPPNVRFRLGLVESDGRSLLTLDPLYKHERITLSHTEVETAVNDGGRWVRRGNTWVKIDQDKFHKIDGGIRQLDLKRTRDGFAFPASQRETVIDLFSKLGSIEHSEAYAAFLLKLADFSKIEDTPLPENLNPEIVFRSYQKHGFNWLSFLHKFGLNGILADDMGLGKTLQTLAVVQKAWLNGASKLPSLIICPTSVVNNWEAEVQKFFKGCRTIVYTGNNRERRLRHLCGAMGGLDSNCENTLVVTSYDIARRDYEKLNRISWLYVIVDEGHNIKNPDAQRTKAIKTINGQHKLALTGTPIQGNLEELWCLFDFIMPGFLGSRTAFRNRYGLNGQVRWDAVLVGNTSLKERIHPFVMRRLKTTVADDLPPKTEVVRKVELTPRQVALYKEVLASADYQRLEQEVNQKGVGRSQTLILAIYTRLRNICNHPALDDSSIETIRCEDAGKLDALKELMEEVIDGEHRVLLFSQSTRMLDIIEQLFGRWRIVSVRLDGSTPPGQRQKLVDEFNRNESIHCFLISTKAGGTGLNLTGADTVIFYDHDWNPANDNQAQDRAYRIGQTKPVTVYKLVAKGTIEERILERQAIKQTLADEIIGSDEQGFKDLTKEELLALFAFNEEDA